MAEILAGLEKAGFRPVVLKGPILAERLYGDPSLRFSSRSGYSHPPRRPGCRVSLTGVVGLPGAMAGLQAGTHERPLTPIISPSTMRNYPCVELHFHLLGRFRCHRVMADACLKSNSVSYRTAEGTTCRILCAPEDEAAFSCGKPSVFARPFIMSSPVYAGRTTFGR